MSDVLLRDVHSSILRLTLNDPKTRNALSVKLLAALQRELDDATADNGVRVVVIAATGPVFSSGHNLKEMIAERDGPDKGAAFFVNMFQNCARLMRSIMSHPKPVIAEVQGLASAAGCELVAACDMAVAADTAGFCTPGVDIGLFCSTPAVPLSRSVMAKPLMEMLLTGETISAEEAVRIGLINRTVSPNRLGEEVETLALKIASKSQATIKLGKEALQRQRGLPLADAYAHAAGIMADNMLVQDAGEGIGAFLAKRRPAWEDR